MKKLVIKIVVFLLLTLLPAVGLQKLIDRGLRNDNSGQYKEWNDMYFSRINADLILLGSSRCREHLSPRIFDSVCSLNSYNLGLSGYGFQMEYYRLLFYLKHNKAPKYIIQTVDPWTLSRRQDLYEYTQFLPYLNDSIIKEAVVGYKGLDWADFNIPLYKYRSNYNLAYSGIKADIRKPPYGNSSYKGFLPRPEHWDTAFRNFKLRNPNGYRYKVNKEAIDLFHQFLDLCKTKGIKVIFVYAPEYIGTQKILLNRDSIMSVFKNYDSAYHIPYFDFTRDSLCLDTNNFYDSQHLNQFGARKFSLKLANELKGVLK